MRRPVGRGRSPDGGLLRAGLLALAVWIVVGCAPDDEPPSSPQAGTEEVSAVGIEAFGCGLRAAVGSGAVVEKTGLVMTVAHIVAGAREIVVVDSDGGRHVAQLRLFDPSSDIAVLAVEGLAAPPLPLGQAVSPPEGAGLLVWDPTDGLQVKPVEINRRLDVTIEDIYFDARVERTAYELSGSIESGDSGGVVIVDGSVVAMVYARARDNGVVGFALDERELRDALDEYREDSAEVDSESCVP